MAADFDPAKLAIIHFPHPTLRYEAKEVKKVDANLKAMVARMFELMYANKGVGLAATQVDIPLRMFVMNSTGQPDPANERVVINPIISKPKSSEEAEEGCLSLPNIHGNVQRAKSIHLNAYSIMGEEINEVLTGFEARIVQHETDHLNGMLFIDRLKEGAEVGLLDDLEALKVDFESRQRTASMPDNSALIDGLASWETRYC